MDDDRKRIGRPLKQSTPGKRMSLGLKVTPTIKDKLDAAASANGRTQSQEAEARLERSFDRQDLLTDAFALAFGDELAREILPMLKAFAGEPNLKITLEKVGGNIGRWQLTTSNPDAKPLTRQEFEELERKYGVKEPGVKT